MISNHDAGQIDRLARKRLQTPVSFTGGYKIVMPLATGGAWKRAGVIALLVGYWTFVSLLAYLVIFGVLAVIGWIAWFIFTMHRRHQILAARRALASRPRSG